MELTLFTTKFENGKKRETAAKKLFSDDAGRENEIINIYPEVAYQVFEGFGGAFTDSSGYVFSLMDKSEKARLIESYFGENGAGYTLGRIHLDSCDFSLAHYEAIAPGDETIESFSLERHNQYIQPLLEAAQSKRGEPIKLIASTWSPPAFMKTTGKRNGGGALLDQYRPLYARYVCRMINELRKAGYHITRLNVQNEPNAVQTWDSCIYTAEQEKVFLRDYLRPALIEAGLGDVGIFIWDHNKERVYERAVRTIDEDTSGFIEGVAFHWYSGDHFEAVDMVRQRFPDKKLVQTEACIEYRHYGKDPMFAPRKYAHDIIGDLNAGMSAFYDWNLLLDEEGGPNHVGNYCEAPFLYDTQTKTLHERPAFAYITHFSKYIRPGAKRIAFSRYAAQLEVTAFKNPDGTIALVVLNDSDETMPAFIRINNQTAEITAPKQSISTAIIQGRS